MIKKWKLEPLLQEARTYNEDLAMETINDNMDDVDVALKYMAIVARKEAAAARQRVTVEGDNGLKITVENNQQAEELSSFLEED